MAVKVHPGLKIGHCKVLSYAGPRGNLHLWSVQCDCGGVRKVLTCSVREGVACKKCGAKAIGNRNRKHGLCASPAYNSWISMKERCSNPLAPNYRHYGGRGIEVCKRWLTFSNFIKDMGARPSVSHSLERINNDGNYEPSNCRWATWKEQNNNRRGNTKIVINGVTKTIGQWAEISGVSIDTIRSRMSRKRPAHELIAKPWACYAK
jgi:hypothetical protein